jgi:plastocyanin
MAQIPNPGVGVDAVIIFDKKGKLKMVVPEEIEIYGGETVRWVIEPQNSAKVTFEPERNPLSDWVDKTETKTIEGRIKANAKATSYKYTVTAGDVIIDPHVRVRR